MYRFQMLTADIRIKIKPFKLCDDLYFNIKYIWGKTTAILFILNKIYNSAQGYKVKILKYE
jgi:hypothetical protein